jgi:predicted GNAT family acetyltransferase
MAEGFTNNAGKERFEYTVNGSIAFANYRREGATLYIDYVEAPPKLRGTGAAGKLMQNIMDFAEKEKLEVIPICGYAVAWIAKNSK